MASEILLETGYAKPAILVEWREWAADRNMVNPHGFDALMFFEFLRQERSYLLSFKEAGDKWQTVHCWLLQARLVRD
jgi:hypothetical protein